MASGGWDTIESDEGVFTYLAQDLGVKNLVFDEIFDLDDASLIGLQSKVYGVIFLFKWQGGNSKSASSPEDGTYDFDAAQGMFFAKQTIQNACATQALLSIILNIKDAQVDIGPHLKDFAEFAMCVGPEDRGECLSNYELIRTVHNSFARADPFSSDQTRAATANDDVYHFIAYTLHNNTLYELDGLQPAPISHGALDLGGNDADDIATTAAFAAALMPVLRRRIARYQTDEIRFALMALRRDPRQSLRDEGESALPALMYEESRRRRWQLENALRRHNFVGFTGSLIKAVVQSKLGEIGGGGGRDRATVDAWVEDAKKRTKQSHKAAV